MSFLSRKNEYLLYDVITEEYLKIDYQSFSAFFAEFGKKYGNQGIPLMELNKQFIRAIVSNNKETSISTNGTAQQFMPSRPQNARSKNVSFDEQLEQHRQHFQQFAMPPPPTPPNFKDAEEPPPPPSDNIEMLMKRALNERKYDAIPPQPARKLQIGSVIEDETHKEDLIDIDKIGKRPPTPPENAFGFFSKLKRIEAIPVPEPEQDVSLLPSSVPLSTTSTPINLQETPNNNSEEMSILSTKIDSLTTTVTNLSIELAETRSQVVLLYAEIESLRPRAVKDYNLEFKESPPLQNK
jgi:hypothetical protein